MKRLFLILIFINALNIFAQDCEPSAWKFSWGHSDEPRIFVIDSFQQNSVVTGFQWYGSKAMNDALKNNIRAGGNYLEFSGNDTNTLMLVHQPKWIDNTDYIGGYYFAPFMQYEPTLPLTSSNIGDILRPADPSNPVFGFLNRKGTIITDSSNENYSRLILFKDSLPIYNTDTVLMNIWPQPRFISRVYRGEGGFLASDGSVGQTDNYFGRKWYLTINLRRLNPTSDNICDDSVVLSIQIPYTLWNGQTSLIKFDSIPISNIDSVENLNYYENRGYSQLMQPASPKPYQLNITRNMLPIRTDTSNITNIF